jgi:opacity protein-like surface antigen
MRKMLLGAVASTALCLGAMQASAADIVEPVPEPMGWSWYVSVFGGWSMADELDGEIEYSGYDYDFEADLDNGFTAGVAVGAHINEWLRGEIELSGNWHDAGGELDFTYYQPYGYDVDGDVDALFVLANLWFEIPIDTFFRPYVGGGIGFGRLSIDVEADYAGYEYDLFDDDDWGFAYQLGAGVAFGMAENIAFDVGYRYKAINNAEFGEDFFTGGGDDVEVDYHSHNIIAGIRIGF